MIRFDQFSWRFDQASSWALHEVSLHIQRGQFVTIAGPSGSGKTTLALAMCGLLVGRHEGRAEGCVHVSGHDVTTTPLHRISQSIGLVQQNPEAHFATLTVRDEIAFGMENRCMDRDVILRRSAEAMALLSISHLVDRGLSTLSGGEKQRVAVASIIAGGPDILVLDEPTASLDPDASLALFQSLADLCKTSGLTVIIIEHKLHHLLPLQPRLVWMEHGHVRLDASGGKVRSDTLDGMMKPQPRTCNERSVETAAVDDEPIVDMTGVAVELGGCTILDSVSLRVRPGEVVAVMGPNGGGKTTLLHALLGLVPPARGTIRVCGKIVTAKAVSQSAGRIGAVFQNADHQLVTDTVWHEALFAARNLRVLDAAVERETSVLLSRAGLLGRKGDHPYRLSWGQKRRLNLISAVLHRPRLLLLDEPFAGQDWENAAFLLDAIDNVLATPAGVRDDDESSEAHLPSGACLMVTHDPRVVGQSCTRILFVENGRISLDAPLPGAFDRLLDMGHNAYVHEQDHRRTAIAIGHGPPADEGC